MRTKRLFRRGNILFAMAFFSGILSCSKDDLPVGSFPEGRKGVPAAEGPSLMEMRTSSDDRIGLKPEIEQNPYVLDTLLRAYALCFPEGEPSFPVSKLTGTTYYLRFLPANEEKYELLKSQEFATSPIPFDRDVAVNGTFYFDPQLEVAGAEYTWEYAMIEKGTELPDIQYEILSEIIDPDLLFGMAGFPGTSVSVWTEILQKSYEISGESMPVQKGESQEGLQGWRPSGSVLAWDSKARRYIPARGAYVVAKGKTRAPHGIVDGNGNFTVGGNISREEARYEIHWGRDHWQIRDGNSKATAVTYVATKSGAVNVGFRSGKPIHFAAMTRALDRMYHLYNYDIDRPTGIRKLKVIYRDSYLFLYLQLIITQ